MMSKIKQTINIKQNISVSNNTMKTTLFVIKVNKTHLLHSYFGLYFVIKQQVFEATLCSNHTYLQPKLLF